MNAQSRNGSAVQNENQEVAEPAEPEPEPEEPVDTCPHYIRSLEIMASKYGGVTESGLNTPRIISVVKAGDSFLQERSVESVTSYLESCRDEVWNTPIPCSPFNGPSEECLFKSFRCAEILHHRTIVDPIRLRVAKILLFWNFEQLRDDPKVLSRISRGRDTASMATDGAMYINVPRRKLNEQAVNMTTSTISRKFFNVHISHLRNGAKISI
jgi:hypothetical protein